MNIVQAFLRGKTAAKTAPLYQYDYGQILKIIGLELPPAYEVHFSNNPHGTSRTSIGGADGVTIPDEYLVTGETVYAWVYLHTGVADGETEYMMTIPVIRRARPTDQAPTPVQQDVITQAIAVLNNAIQQTAGSASDAAASKTAAQTAQGYAEAAQTASEAARDRAEAAQSNASTSATNAAQSAANAAQSASNAAASAQNAYIDAERAEQAASTAGYMWITIDGNGHLIYERTDQVDVDLALDNNGHLIMGVI